MRSRKKLIFGIAGFFVLVIVGLSLGQVLLNKSKADILLSSNYSSSGYGYGYAGYGYGYGHGYGGGTGYGNTGYGYGYGYGAYAGIADAKRSLKQFQNYAGNPSTIYLRTELYDSTGRAVSGYSGRYYIYKLVDGKLTYVLTTPIQPTFSSNVYYYTFRPTSDGTYYISSQATNSKGSIYVYHNVNHINTSQEYYQYMFTQVKNGSTSFLDISSQVPVANLPSADTGFPNALVTSTDNGTFLLATSTVVDSLGKYLNKSGLFTIKNGLVTAYSPPPPSTQDKDGGTLYKSVVTQEASFYAAGLFNVLDQLSFNGYGSTNLMTGLFGSNKFSPENLLATPTNVYILQGGYSTSITDQKMRMYRYTYSSNTSEDFSQKFTDFIKSNFPNDSTFSVRASAWNAKDNYGLIGLRYYKDKVYQRSAFVRMELSGTDIVFKNITPTYNTASGTWSDISLVSGMSYNNDLNQIGIIFEKDASPKYYDGGTFRLITPHPFQNDGIDDMTAIASSGQSWLVAGYGYGKSNSAIRLYKIQNQSETDITSKIDNFRNSKIWSIATHQINGATQGILVGANKLLNTFSLGN